MGSLSLLLAMDAKMEALPSLLMWIGVFFFGAAALTVLIPLILRRPVLEADEKGVRVSYMFMGGFLPWEQVRNVRAYGMGRIKYIAVEPSDTEAYIRAQAFVFRPLLRKTASLKSPVCCALVDCRRNSNEHVRLAHAVNAIRHRVRSEHAV